MNLLAGQRVPSDKGFLVRFGRDLLCCLCLTVDILRIFHLLRMMLSSATEVLHFPGDHVCCSHCRAKLSQNGALDVLKHLVQNTGFEKDFQQREDRGADGPEIPNY